MKSLEINNTFEHRHTNNNVQNFIRAFNLLGTTFYRKIIKFAMRSFNTIRNKCIQVTPIEEIS